MAVFAFGITFLTVFMAIFLFHSTQSSEVDELLDFSEFQGLPRSNLSKIKGYLRSKREGMVVNELADPLIDDFRKKLLSKNQNIVAVNNLKESFSFKMFGKNFKYVTFEGYNARIKDISTIYRIGDVLLEKAGKGITVSFRFGFWILEYYCDTYLFKFTWLKFSGRLSVTVEESEVLFEGTIHQKNYSCRFEVNNLSVIKFDGIKVKMTGFSVLDRLMNFFVEKVLESFKETIKRTVEKELVNSLTVAIEKSGVCMKL